MSEETNQQIDQGTYEIIRSRLAKEKEALVQKLNQLNTERQQIFGGTDFSIAANERINTENQGVARDIAALGDLSILGYNVHFGLRTQIELKDVFGIYRYQNKKFETESFDLISDERFISDFHNLYKYYRDTVFSRFTFINGFLYMVFQLSENQEDIKAFKWLIKDQKLEYIDDRSAHEVRYPQQYEFNWVECSRDHQRDGKHPHISMADKVFVETIGGDLTIKIENNTDSGKGIYEEKVEYKDQTLDDGRYRYADLGNLVLMGITPYQEKERFFIFNSKVKEVVRADSIQHTAVLLPQSQGVIFANGYYLQTGNYNLFDKEVKKVRFLKRIPSANGEDVLFVFYDQILGEYLLMSYNMVNQQLETPIKCNGYTLFENGDLCYFRVENDPTRHHVIQIWNTPYSKDIKVNPSFTDHKLYTIGNKEIVNAQAECNELVLLLSKEDSYEGLYDDIVKQAKDIKDSYFWIKDPEAYEIGGILENLIQVGNNAIGEFEKVKELRENARKALQAAEAKTEEVFSQLKTQRFEKVDQFVDALTQLRELLGECHALKEIRYTDLPFLETLEVRIKEKTEELSDQCTGFLTQDEALSSYEIRISGVQAEISKLQSVVRAQELEKELVRLGEDMELLIQMVNNLPIKDNQRFTKILENISGLFSTINQIKLELSKKKKSLAETEAASRFAAEMSLLEQSVINYLELSHSPEKCDENLTQLSIKLEELEAAFADFDAYIEELTEKRTDIYNTFENKKVQLSAEINKKAESLMRSGERILTAIEARAEKFEKKEEIDAYFAGDAMVQKLRDIAGQLQELNDSAKSERILNQLKTSRESAHRSLKDKNELFEDGTNIIKLGNFPFLVNKLKLGLSMVMRNGLPHYHLNGTSYFEPIAEELFEGNLDLWAQNLPSENEQVYRSEYLAYQIFESHKNLAATDDEALLKALNDYMLSHLEESYQKGVHDYDALLILKGLLSKHQDLKNLRYAVRNRVAALWYWILVAEDERKELEEQVAQLKEVLHLFPKTQSSSYLLGQLEAGISAKNETPLLPNFDAQLAAEYLLNERLGGDHFALSASSEQFITDFLAYLKKKKADHKFKALQEDSDLPALRKFHQIKEWVEAYAANEEKPIPSLEEVSLFLMDPKRLKTEVIHTEALVTLSGFKGSHAVLQSENDQSIYLLDYHAYQDKMQTYTSQILPAYMQLRQRKKQLLDAQTARLKPQEMQAGTLSSFVRNKLINQVLLPLFGENLSKQLGTAGENKRTDRMGMLLLVSPPGYGKTTLMEYLSNRLGLAFVKINGPTLGHEITTLDPAAARNSAAKSELLKLNTSFEMADNVMLYLDDIQHLNPEFLQKFISLADGSRRVDGVFNGESKTYDLRGKRFCIVMAGNPYTETGDKFQIPDMLANRADIYNLGDIAGGNDDFFRLSLIENSLSANDSLRALTRNGLDDFYALYDYIASGEQSSLQLGQDFTKQEVADFSSVIKKVIRVRSYVEKVNALYISSAAMQEEFRTEPSFRLQGSYRDMNKLVGKIVPILNEEELDRLVLSHYENEAQTLTTGTEVNLLKIKELFGWLSPEEKQRWENILTDFRRSQKLKGYGSNEAMAGAIMALENLSTTVAQVGERLAGKQKAKD